MASNAWFIPTVIAIICAALFLGILSAKKDNGRLAEELNHTSYLLKKGTDNFADCTKDDAKKAGEIQAKQKKFSSLDAEFNAADAQKAELLKKERELNGELRPLNADIKSLQKEILRLEKELQNI